MTERYDPRIEWAREDHQRGVVAPPTTRVLGLLAELAAPSTVSPRRTPQAEKKSPQPSRRNQ